jgi:hypothetical protein
MKLGKPALPLLMVVSITLLAATAVMQLAGAPGGLMPVAEAQAEEAWKPEFDDLCSKTDAAMDTTREELQSLVTRCDKLKPLLEKLDEAPRKVYLKRLKMARDLYQYVLDSKNGKQEAK